MATKRKASRKAGPDPRQVSFVVAKTDVAGAIESERQEVLEHLRKALRAGDSARTAELRCALEALSAVEARVERLGMG